MMHLTRIAPLPPYKAFISGEFVRFKSPRVDAHTLCKALQEATGVSDPVLGEPEPGNEKPHFYWIVKQYILGGNGVSSNDHMYEFDLHECSNFTLFQIRAGYSCRGFQYEQQLTGINLRGCESTPEARETARKRRALLDYLVRLPIRVQDNLKYRKFHGRMSLEALVDYHKQSNSKVTQQRTAV